MFNDYEYTTDLQEAVDGDGLYEEEFDFEDEGESFENMDVMELEDYEEEGDEFLGSLVSGIAKVASGPIGGMVGNALKSLAGPAAAAAGRAIAGPRGARIARSIAHRCLRESEMYGEYEAMNDYEGELAAMGGDTAVLGEMTQLASMASQAKTPEEADHFIGAIASLAGNLLPQLLGNLGEEEGEEEGDEFFPALIPLAAQLLPAAMPLISKGIRSIGRMLTRRRGTREAAAVLPPIAAKAVTSLAKQAQAGKKITKDRVAATVANAAAKTLASKPSVVKAIKKSRKIARKIQAVREGEGEEEWGGYGSSGYTNSYSRGYSPSYGTRRRTGRRVIRPRYCVY